MSGVLWNKEGIEIDRDVMRFLAGDDIVLDRELFIHDLEASKVHTRGLAKIDALTTAEADSICSTLDELDQLWASGEFTLDEQFEDGHSAIESFLTQKLGPLGGKVHLGRSRNDQVQVAIRMYMRSSINKILSQLLDCAQAALEQAREHESDAMPGYTHLQRAVPSTLGLWYASFAESFIESASLMAMTGDWINCSPLGTAAGYGVNLPLPRVLAADQLGFDRVTVNPMTAQAERGKFEHQVISAQWQAMQDVRRLAWDLSLFSTQEFGFVTIPNRASTGSSIMPNKRNPDLVELLRASSGVVAGCMNELQQVLSLPSGYHRDLQLTKKPLIRATKVCIESLSFVPMLIKETVFDQARLRSVIDASMLATDRAIEMTRANIPFREAYKSVAAQSMELEPSDIDASIRARVSYGACANLGLKELSDRAQEIKNRFVKPHGFSA